MEIAQMIGFLKNNWQAICAVGGLIVGVVALFVAVCALVAKLRGNALAKKALARQESADRHQQDLEKRKRDEERKARLYYIDKAIGFLQGYLNVVHEAIAAHSRSTLPPSLADKRTSCGSEFRKTLAAQLAGCDPTLKRTILSRVENLKEVERLVEDDIAKKELEKAIASLQELRSEQ